MKKLTLILLSMLMIVTLAACGEKCEQHIYDDCADIECNVCGETRDSMHTWVNANCDSPKTCSVCGKTEGEALGHEWTTPDVDLCEVQSTCSRCGATDGENKEHTPEADDGDCSTEVKCSVCGDVTTPAGQHTPNEDDGDCTTPITCSVCGTTTTPANANHTGGTATCTEKAKCTACGTAYGTVDANNHIDANTDHICDRECGKTGIGTHADSDEDNDHVCDYGCGETLNNHEGGTATCAAQAVCTICGNGYGDLLEHNYTYTANGDANTITESCDNVCNHSKTITLKAPENAVYNGSEHPACVEGAIDAKYDLTYDALPTNADNYTATLSVGEVSVSVTYSVAKATPTVTAPTANTLTYTGEAQQLVSAGSANFGAMMYRLGADGEFTTTIPTATDADTYEVYYYAKGDGSNINDSTVASVTVNIAKANPTFTAPTANTITYNGATQDLVAGHSADGGEMQYFVGDNASTNDSDWSDVIPGGKDAGDYKVWWRVKGDENYSDIGPYSFTVTISPITITADMITVNSTVYNGEVQTPNGDHVTVIVNGSTLVHNIDYYIGVPADVEFINAGTYPITIYGDGNYTGSVEMTFTIKKTLTITQISMNDTDSPFAGGWSDDNEIALLAIGTQNSGKTAWEVDDQIIITLTSKYYGTQTCAITYDGAYWDTEVSFSYLEGETPTVSVIYAPCYKADGTMQDGMQLGMTEYLVGEYEIGDGFINVSFANATRNYSRLRISALPGQTLTVTTTGFTSAGATSEATKAFTLTADENGNADLYGTFAVDATVSVMYGAATLAEFTFSEDIDFANGTEQGKSYALDARPVIDGTLGGKTTATEEDITALVEQIKTYVDNGITTIIVTGSKSPIIDMGNYTTTAIGEAIYRLSGNGTHSADNPYNGKIDLILPDVTEIVDYEFEDAFALNSITLPKVTTVGNGAFYYCKYLQELTFGSVVTSIKQDSFLPFDGVGEYVEGGLCNLVLNAGQTTAATEYQPDILSNNWWKTSWKSITLI